MAIPIFVKKARKDNPAVKKGESYFWWKFKFSNKHYSKTSPTRSQLTQSNFLSQIYNIEDNMAKQDFSSMDSDIIQFTINEFVEELQNLLDECQENLDNIPEQLQESSNAGQTLQRRIDGLEEAISELEFININFDDDDETEYERREEIQIEFENIYIEY